jgi:predicted lysophospholipase L1 biosynthesis ABC-type transport system permease subunit
MRSPLVLRNISAHRIGFAATAATALFATAVTAAVTSFVGTVSASAVRHSLASDSSNTILMTAPATASSAPQLRAAFAGAAGRALPGLPVKVTSSLVSDYLDLPARGPRVPRGAHAQAQIISLPALSRHATLVSGAWPAAASGSGPADVCLPQRAAQLLRLRPGSVLALRDSLSHSPVPVRIACTFRPDGHRNSYWALDPLGRAAVRQTAGYTVYGPLVGGSELLASGRIPVVSATSLVQPDFGRFRVADLAASGQQVAAVLASLVNSRDADVTTSLPGTLASLAIALVVARSQLLIGLLILLVIVAVALAVAVRMLAEQRKPEVSLRAARGASRRQLAARGASEAACLAIPAAVIGPLIGSRLVPLIGHVGSLAAARLRVGAALTPTAWLASAAVAAGCAVIIALPWQRRPASAVLLRTRSGRQRAVATAVSAGADVALVALAALAGWQLAHFHAPVSTGIDGALGVDPVLVSAPVLALAAGTAILLRVLPLAARIADRAAARGRGLSVAVASWQLSRRPLRQAGPALLAVLAVATAVIALAEHSSWQRSARDQAAFTVGADERVTMPPGAQFGMEQVTDITAAPGVTASTPAVRIAAALPSGQYVNLLGLNLRAAAGIVPLRPSGASSPAAMLRGLAPARPARGTVLPGHPVALRVTVRLGRARLGRPALALQLTDADGIGYSIPVGTVPADGRAHRLTVGLGAGEHADYPLRLSGFSLQFAMPPGGRGKASLSDTLTVDSVQAAPSAGGRYGPGLPAVSAQGAAPLSLVTAGNPAAVSAPPRVNAPKVSSGGVTTVTFSAGLSAPSNGVFDTNFDAGGVPTTLTVTANPGLDSLPALVTKGFLASTGQHLGATIPFGLDGATVVITLRREINAFPTAGNGIVVDQSALQDALRAAGAAPIPVTEWWLRTARVPVLTGLPPGTSQLSRAAVTLSLLTQPLSTAPQQALLAIAAAAVLLAAAGFVVSVATARERARDVALLDALGTPPGTVTRLLCLEQALLAIPAAGAGLLLGVLLSHLIVPAVSLTSQATTPVPPVLVQVPWASAAALAAAIAVAPTLAAAAGTLRRIPTAARLRLEEET